MEEKIDAAQTTHKLCFMWKSENKILTLLEKLSNSLLITLNLISLLR